MPGDLSAYTPLPDLLHKRCEYNETMVIDWIGCEFDPIADGIPELTATGPNQQQRRELLSAPPELLTHGLEVMAWEDRLKVQALRCEYPSLFADDAPGHGVDSPEKTLTTLR